MRAHCAHEPDLEERSGFYLAQIAAMVANCAMGRNGKALKPTELDPWHDPWETEVPSVDEQRAALRRSFDSKPLEPSE